MKIKLLFIFLISNLIFLHGIILPDGTDVLISNLEKYENGKIKSIVLSEPVILNTPLGKYSFYESKSMFMGMQGSSTVEFFENGNFKSGNLRDITEIPTTYGKYKASFISFYEDGSLDKIISPLEYDSVRQGRDVILTPKPSSQIKTNFGTFPVGGELIFYQNGKVKHIEFGKEIRFTTLLLNSQEEIKITQAISFFENGSISYINIYKPQVIRTNFGRLKLANDVEFWNNGNIKNAELPGGLIIETPIGLLNVEKIEAYLSGKIMKINLVDRNTPNINTSFGAIIISNEKPVIFYENGSIQECHLSMGEQNKLITKYGTFRADGVIKFFENGNVKSFNLDTMTHSLVTNFGDFEFDNLFFYDTGNVKGGYLRGYSNRIDNQQVLNKYIIISEEGDFLGYGKYDEIIDELELIQK